MSPRELITGFTIDYNKHCKLPYVTYVHIHKSHSNNMVPQTVGAIALRPTGNHQGDYFFFSLNSGQRINHNSWTVLLIPSDTVD
eukprot:3827229-Ditylum_brightwellii.AAC.1